MKYVQSSGSIQKLNVHFYDFFWQLNEKKFRI